MAIDGRDSNPMKDPGDIEIYNQKIQVQLLTAVDDRYETLKMDLLIRDPLPTAETSYGAIRREEARIGILRGIPSESSSSSGIRVGLRLKTQGRIDGRGIGTAHSRSQPSSRDNKEDKSKLVCIHCEMRKHTKEMCFQLVGHPDW